MSVDPRANSPEKIKLPDVEWYPLPYISRRALKRVKNPLPPLVTCPTCGPNAPVFLVNNEEIYGREYGDWPYAYLCENCDSYVGLHPGTDLPLGTMADKETREARKRNKLAFFRMKDELGISRSEAYKRLAEGLSIPVSECHWSWFDAERCKQAGAVCREIIKQASN